LPNGSLDSSFSGGFISWSTQSQTLPGYIRRIHIDEQSRIVLLGVTDSQTPRNVLVRLSANGNLDTSLNGTGFLVFNYQDPTQIDYEEAIDLIPFNGGYTIVGGGDSDRRQMQNLMYSGITRTSADGSIDQSFGTNGVLLPFPQVETYFVDIAELPDGSSLITGNMKENDQFKILMVKIPPRTSTPATPPTTTPPPASTPVAAVPPSTTVPVADSSVDEPIKLVVTVSQAVILKRAKVTVPKGGKVSLKSTTPRVCKVVKAKVQAVNTGTCRITITVTTSAKKKTTKKLSFKVT
jgi:hypothetical protein